MDYEFILICSTGRSGSTTLQRILNTIPNTNICGENDNAIIHLLEFYKSLKNKYIVNADYSYFVKNNIKPSWYNHYDTSSIISHIKHMIIQFLNYNNRASTLGFKEIRYDETNIHLLNEFKELFPKTKIIVHIKNPELQCNSGWWAENPEQSKKILFEKNNALVKYYINNKKDTYLTCFKDLFDLEKLYALFVFLERDQFFDQLKIIYIINNNQEPYIMDSCNSSQKRFALF